jgi:hypothetical protein
MRAWRNGPGLLRRYRTEAIQWSPGKLTHCSLSVLRRIAEVA